MARRLTKLALAATLAFGMFKGVEAGFDPQPGQLRPVFNEQAAVAGATPSREYKQPSLVVPENVDEVWRIRLGSWEMANGGHHTFLEFTPYKAASKANPSGNEVYQIQGIAMDEKRLTWAVLDFTRPAAYTRYMAGDYVLKAFGVNEDHNRKIFGKEPMSYVDLYYGSKDDVLKMYMDALSLTVAINLSSDSYRLVDHNSNSVQHTMLEGLGLPLPGLYAPHQLNTMSNDRIWAPGIEISLLPKDWDRQKARDAGGYGQLSGDALEKAARKASLGQNGVWIKERSRPDFKPGM
ncbi:MAG: hypothetical protein ACAH83_15630 [Alphaproteobacteria bacterium]